MFKLRLVTHVSAEWSPEVRLDPDDFALLLLDDVLQVVQQGGAVAPAVRRNGAVQAGQLVQQRLLAPGALQQLRLRYGVLAEFVSASGKQGRITTPLAVLPENKCPLTPTVATPLQINATI